MVGDPPRYRVLETVYDVTGGTAVQALEHELNSAKDYRLVGATRVRAEGEEAVDVVILERVEI